MTQIAHDIVDSLAGIAAGSRLDQLRQRRPVTREQIQQSFLALFEPADTSHATLVERYAIAAFVSGLHGAGPAADFFRASLERLQPHLVGLVDSEIKLARTSGPFGRYPAGPLSAEDSDGKVYQASPDAIAKLGAKLAAAFDHAHLLVFHPRDADPEALRKLTTAGWSTTGAVTVSQLVAFLSFQLRVVAGLAVLNA